MNVIFYNKDKVAQAIGELVVGSDAQNEIAEVLCEIAVYLDKPAPDSDKIEVVRDGLSHLAMLFNAAVEYAE